MKIGILAGLCMLLLACRSMVGQPALQLYDIESGRYLSGRQAIEALKSAQLILIGEMHTSQWHHEAQLAVIEALEQSGRRVAIGLEMIRRESQDALDRWVSGRISEEQFVPIFLDNWMDWGLYRPIFEYAREKRIPMIGLNVPRSVSSQVARQGFDSLGEEQKQGLGSITCDVPDAYREFVSEAYEAHPHGSIDFDHFCQAQLLWDKVMAKNSAEYLNTHPDMTLVVLAGSGHARKPAVPALAGQQGIGRVKVLLPETPRLFEPGTVSSADADYLIVCF